MDRRMFVRNAAGLAALASSGTVRADVVNLIPRQRAAGLVAQAGLAIWPISRPRSAPMHWHVASPAINLTPLP